MRRGAGGGRTGLVGEVEGAIGGGGVGGPEEGARPAPLAEAPEGARGGRRRDRRIWGGSRVRIRRQLWCVFGWKGDKNPVRNSTDVCL